MTTKILPIKTEPQPPDRGKNMEGYGRPNARERCKRPRSQKFNLPSIPPLLTPPEKEAKVEGLLETPTPHSTPHMGGFFIEDKKGWKCNAKDLTISERKSFFHTRVISLHNNYPTLFCQYRINVI